ncbi:hypothetical protein [Pseudomonas sp. PS01299]|uniref:hypothetical protein n=1 Tax=Pseudomonas sp. PS01299 TaxID=2991435 RepID=UPI00249BC89A|nr:hypothetical protein [Pseudomonas sp. PS01299]
MLLQADFVKDWTAELRRIMTDDWAMDVSQVSETELPILFFHAGKRRIEPRPRVIKLSASFVCPSELESGWNALKAKIESGANLAPHLSLGIERVMGKDPLLLDWGVYHLHLGESVHPTNGSFVDRTGPVVFGYPTKDVFHAIGIYQHGQWNDSSVIETLNSNWPELTGTAKLSGVLGVAQNYTDDDRKKLRAAGVNVITALSDGTFLASLGGGYSTNGVSISGVRSSDQQQDKMLRIQEQVHNAAHEIEAALIAEGYDGTHEVRARLNFAPGKCWVSFEGFKLKLEVE